MRSRSATEVKNIRLRRCGKIWENADLNSENEKASAPAAVNTFLFLLLFSYQRAAVPSGTVYRGNLSWGGLTRQKITSDESDARGRREQGLV